MLQVRASVFSGAALVAELLGVEPFIRPKASFLSPRPLPTPFPRPFPRPLPRPLGAAALAGSVPAADAAWPMKHGMLQGGNTDRHTPAVPPELEAFAELKQCGFSLDTAIPM